MSSVSEQMVRTGREHSLLCRIRSAVVHCPLAPFFEYCHEFRVRVVHRSLTFFRILSSPRCHIMSYVCGLRVALHLIMSGISPSPFTIVFQRFFARVFAFNFILLLDFFNQLCLFGRFSRLFSRKNIIFSFFNKKSPFLSTV